MFLREVANLLEQEAVFVDRGIVELSRFCICQAPFTGSLNRDRLISVLRLELRRFHLADDILRFLPVRDVQRFANLTARKKSIYPDRAATAAILAAGLSMVAVLSVSPGDRRSQCAIGIAKEKVKVKIEPLPG